MKLARLVSDRMSFELHVEHELFNDDRDHSEYDDSFDGYVDGV